MSAIGDYIHLSKQGYQSKTKNPEKEPFFDSSYAAYSRKKEEIQRRINALKTKHNLQSIQNKYNNMFLSLTQLGDMQNIKDNQEASYLNKVKKQIDEYFTQTFPSFYVDWSTLEIKQHKELSNLMDSAEKQVNDKEKQMGSKLKKADSQQIIYQSTIESRLNFIKAYIDRFQDSGGMQEIENSLASLTTEFKTLVEDCGTIVRETSNGNTEIEKDAQQTHKDVKLAFNTAMAEITNDKGEIVHQDRLVIFMNKVNQLLKKCFSNLKAAKGDLLEFLGYYLGSYILSTATQKHVQSFATVMKKGVSGGHPAGSGYLESNFPSEFAKLLREDANMKSIKMDNGDTFFQVIPTKNKVDFTIGLSTRDPLRVSAKNISFQGAKAGVNTKVKNHIKLQGGTNFLLYVQNENSDNFVNHFLNLAIPKVKNAYFKDTSTSFVDPWRLNLYHVLMQKIIILKALTGDNTLKMFSDGGLRPMETANVFMVRNSDDNTVRFVSTQQLLSPLLSLDGFFIDNYDQMLSLTGYSKDDYDSASKRITAILVKLRQIRLTPYISIDRVTQMASK